MLRSCLAALALVGSAPLASAGPLTGQTLGASGGFKALSPSSAQVGAGVEFRELNIVQPTFTNDLLFDFDENGLVRVSFDISVLASLNHVALDNQTFTDVNATIAQIIGFDLISTSGVTGIVQSDLSFTADSVSMSIGSGSSWNPNSFFTAQIRFADPIQAPEPGTLALLGLGLAGLGLSRRRKA